MSLKETNAHEEGKKIVDAKKSKMACATSAPSLVEPIRPSECRDHDGSPRLNFSNRYKLVPATNFALSLLLIRQISSCLHSRAL